jgi:hypothetical protein
MSLESRTNVAWSSIRSPHFLPALIALAMAAVLPSAQAQAAPTVDDPDSIRMTGVGFAGPESVLHHEVADVYLVSNINGGPTEVDDNGFISRISPDGELLELTWIDGEDRNVELDAPKGMAVSGAVLFVADIAKVRMFDVETGEQLGSIEVSGASFLNDVVAAPGGGVYVTDTGVGPDFQPTGGAAVYHLNDDGEVHEILASVDLGAPNGVATMGPGRLVIVTFSDPGRIIRTDDGEVIETQELTAGSLDGVVALPGGDLLLSSWTARAVLRLESDGSATPVVEGLESPADIGFDSVRRTILIPLLNSNEVMFVDLPAA